jgi:prolyl oligopeptidase
MSSPLVPPAPPARIDDVVETLHGVDVHDPYRWLEDGDAPETRAWAEAQNVRTRAVLDALPGRDGMHAGLSGLLRAGSAGGPRVAGERVFSLERWGDHDQAVLVMRSLEEPGPPEPAAGGAGTPPPSGSTGQAVVVLDPHAATGDETAAVDWFHPSKDGERVAYGVSTAGDERSVLRVFEVATGEHLPVEIPDTRAASVAWWPDGSGFAYARYPAGGEYGRHIRTHRLGDDPADDPVLFPAPDDPAAWPDVSLARDGLWYVIHVAHGWTRTDVHLVERATGERVTVVEGVEGLTGFEVVGDRLVGSTTVDADRGRVITAPLATPTPEHWATLVPEGDGVLDGLVVTPTALLVATSLEATSRLDRYDLDGRRLGPVPLPELGSLGGLSASKDREVAMLSYSGFVRPSTLFRWTPDDGLVQWSYLPGAPDPSSYAVEQVSYPSTDGTEITMFLVGPKPPPERPEPGHLEEGFGTAGAADAGAGAGGGVVRAADTPVILTGYGGFSVTMSPAWSPLVVAHCDAGGVYAVACIRGGAERGEAWHRAGMRQRKQQVFDDFAAAADWLVAEGWTSRDRLAIRGGSNGGLLMGATVTQRPDLCRAVHCAVPLLDMVRYHRFRIAKLWVPEYGDPESPDDFDWLHAYSPYHHVADGTCYPAQLVTTGEDDSRVDPNHARKFAARMQAATACGSDRPVLVRIETRAGHGQGKPVSKQADELADVLSFLHWQLGVT